MKICSNERTKFKRKLPIFSVFLAFFIIFLVIPTPSQADFNKDISIGENSQDVYNLQLFLNKDADTRVAQTGPGSPGNETNYFGFLTKEAVVKFQEKYKSDILTPSGLSRGTGFVGPKTRARLNALLLNGSNPTKIVPEFNSVKKAPMPQNGLDGVSGSVSNSAANFMAAMFKGREKELHLMQLSTNTIDKGQTLLLYGDGFDNETVLHLGDQFSYHLAPKNAFVTDFTIPQEIPYGHYYVWLSNGSSESGKNRFIVITDGKKLAPKIDVIEPNSFNYGDSVVITGKGFDHDNDIYTNFGIYRHHLSNDNKTISFTFENATFAKLQALKNKGKPVADLDIPIQINIVNDNGSTQKPYQIILKIRKW